MALISSAFVADPELLKELEKRAKPVALGHNSVLFHQGGAPVGVYILKRGKAQLTGHSEGEAMVRVTVSAGSLLGLPAVIASKPYTMTAEAVQDAEFSLVSCEDFVDLMRTEPVFSFRVLQVLAAEVRFARETLAQA